MRAERKNSKGYEAGIWRGKNRGKKQTLGQFKRGGESRVPRLDSYNKFNVLAIEIDAGTSKTEGSKKMEVRKAERY